MAENKVTFTRYIINTLIALSAIILFLTVVGPLVGTEAQGTSALFALGAAGIPYIVVVQALALAVYTNTVWAAFMSNLIFKKMMFLWRTIWMFACILTGVGALSVWFGWFPASDPIAWMAYLLSAGIMSGLSALVMVLKTRYENAKVNKKLQEYKKQKQQSTSSTKGV